MFFVFSLFFSFIKLSLIGLSVIGTFVVIWLPILSIKLDMMLNVIERIFPFSRGLFEVALSTFVCLFSALFFHCINILIIKIMKDKVANFWCSLSVLVKLREKFDINTLSKISLLVTALLNLPSGFNLLLKPSKAKFLLALVNSALIFFLFSFQVHEKSILLATVLVFYFTKHNNNNFGFKKKIFLHKKERENKRKKN